jgi:hypothetical protein
MRQEAGIQRKMGVAVKRNIRDTCSYRESLYHIATMHLHLTNALSTFTASLSRSSSASFSKLLIISFSSLVFLASWANSKSYAGSLRLVA